MNTTNYTHTDWYSTTVESIIKVTSLLWDTLLVPFWCFILLNDPSTNDTSIKRTSLLVPMVSVIEGFHCINYTQTDMHSTIIINALVYRTLTQLYTSSTTDTNCTTQAKQSNCKQINYDTGWSSKKHAWKLSFMKKGLANEWNNVKRFSW